MSSTARDTVLTFLNLWATSDLDAAREYLDSEIVFESPQGTLSGIEAVADAMGQFSQLVSSISVLAVISNETGSNETGNNDTGANETADVIVMYDMHTLSFGTIRAAEYYQVRHAKIVSDRLVFDTARLAPSGT